MKPVPPNAYKPGTQLTVGSHSVVITKYISEGGYAHVYACEISPAYNDNKVACLKRVAVPDKVTLNILRAEVDAMKRLKGHRCIVSYIDSHASRMTTGVGYEVFVLMEYCSGHGLIDFMNSRLVNKLTEPEVLKIMAEITEGVCNMHAMTPPLIHRDIKIENVLISGNGDYKLCDFGSASGVLRPPRNVEEFKILQDDIMKHTTAQYRAPEMIDLYRGFPIDEKSDVWALGVFLYKVCYYTTPFENNHINGNSGGGEYAILNAKYQFPSSPVYSSRLKNIISKLLVVDPRARPNTFQLLQEVCNMRNQPVPIEDWHKKRATPPQEEIKPSLPSRPPPLQAAVKVVQSPSSSTQNQNQKDLFSSIDKSKFLSGSGISSYSRNNSKSQPALSANLGTMISSHIHDLNQNGLEMNRASDTDKFAKPTSRPSRPGSRTTSSNIKRPVSMYVSDDFKTYLSSSDQMETLKQKITGRMETVEFEPDPKLHIDSNVDFLRNLSRQDSGRSLWRSQNTGDSVKSSYSRISSHNTGTRKASEERKKKRSSISSLKSLLTGDRKDSKLKAPPTHSRSKSRTPSYENYTSKSSDSLNGFQSIYHSSSSSNNSTNSVYSSASAKNSRKSSESIKEDPEPPTVDVPPQRTKSIQSRVQMLLSRTQDPAPVKTASGYGKYTELESSSSVKDFKKPDLKRSITPQQQLLYRTESKTSTASTYSTITPQSTLNRISTSSTPKVSGGVAFSDLSPVIGSSSSSTLTKKKLPPPKPRKPKYLKSPPKKRQEADSKERHLVVEKNGDLHRLSINSDIDVDDLEREFNERFPSAL